VRRNIVESFTSAVRNSLFGLTLQRCGAPFPGYPQAKRRNRKTLELSCVTY
jgi:hypothetical protein